MNLRHRYTNLVVDVIPSPVARDDCVIYVDFDISHLRRPEELVHMDMCTNSSVLRKCDISQGFGSVTCKTATYDLFMQV